MAGRAPKGRTAAEKAGSTRKKEAAPPVDDECYCQGDAGTLVRALKRSTLGSPYATPERAGAYWQAYFAGSPLVDEQASLFLADRPGTLALCRDGTAVTYNLLAGCWDPRGTEWLARLGVSRLRKVIYDTAARAWQCYRGVHAQGWRAVSSSG
jgi:hypothetical protein